jgi:hypothetical protein
MLAFGCSVYWWSSSIVEACLLDLELLSNGLSPGSETTIMDRVISTILKGSNNEVSTKSLTNYTSGDSQTRFSCPVPTLRQTKRTIPEAIVRAPNANVTVTPVEFASTPLISRIAGIA